MITVLGGGGFIGGHLVSHLRNTSGAAIRSVDIKPLSEWHQTFPDVENLQLDLKDKENCFRALKDARVAYNLAADMGGMGFIQNNKAACMLNVLINTHLLMAARELGLERFFFASSACVYSAEKQMAAQPGGLREEDAYPALPEDGYGWEKLFSERMCRHFREDFGLETRIARYHNIYGPHGTWNGGREKAPAAICRKVIEAKLSGKKEIVVWGTGEQLRSFTYIDDCIRGTLTLKESSVAEPVNVGSSEMVSINDLIDFVEEIAGIRCKRIYDPRAPIGVNARSSDNTLFRRYFGWEPSTALKEGLRKTYDWIFAQMEGM